MAAHIAQNGGHQLTISAGGALLINDKPISPIFTNLGTAGLTATFDELNKLDGVTATAGELNLVDDICASVSIAIAASVTVDGMDITFTVLDAAGVAIDAVHMLEWWISEDAQGEALTGDTYSGDVTTVTGTEFQEIVSKKHYIGQTLATGVMTCLAVASANPTDQYVCCKNPVNGKVHVSAISGTNWEGA